jgi:hypothetical protein
MMMKKKDSAMWEYVYRKNGNIVYRTVADEALLVPVGKSDTALGYIYSLNEVASRVWELLDGSRSLKEVRAALLEEFQVDEKTLSADIEVLVEDLKHLKLIG